MMVIVVVVAFTLDVTNARVQLGINEEYAGQHVSMSKGKGAVIVSGDGCKEGEDGWRERRLIRIHRRAILTGHILVIIIIGVVAGSVEQSYARQK